MKSELADSLKETFSGLTLKIIENHLNNQHRDSLGYRHNDEAKKFAMTLHFYSPRANEYLRSVFSFPHPSPLGHRTNSIKCEPGYFLDVFKRLSEITAQPTLERDAVLLFDAMTIRSNVFYNKSIGSFEGFVSFGENLLVCDEEKVATEALVFMLVSMLGSWKYPIGYVLIDKINSDNLHCLVSRALDLCISHDLNVRTVTCDGTSTNFQAMRQFGCTFEKNEEEISGTFTYGNYNHPLYFTPDAPHMLKLARNAQQIQNVLWMEKII